MSRSGRGLRRRGGLRLGRGLDAVRRRAPTLAGTATLPLALPVVPAHARAPAPPPPAAPPPPRPPPPARAPPPAVIGRRNVDDGGPRDGAGSGERSAPA